MRVGPERRTATTAARTSRRSWRLRWTTPPAPETAEVFNGLIRHIEQSSDAEVDFAVTVGLGCFRINSRYATD